MAGLREQQGECDGTIGLLSMSLPTYPCAGPTPFIGLWHIASTETWDEDYFNQEVQAFVEFKANGTGHFQFGYVSGCIDWRPTTRDGQPAVEWSWEGGDGADGIPLTGRGWAILDGDEVNGMFCIHEGDDSEFVAKKKDQPPSKPKKLKKPKR